MSGGCFLIQPNMFPQKRDLTQAILTGSGFHIKPTKSQSGGFLGTLLASVGIPLLLNALTGKGLQVDSQRSRRSIPVYIPPTNNEKDGGLIVPWKQPPPFFGSWNNPIGMGVKKKKFKKGERLAIGKKQSVKLNLIIRPNVPKFIDKLLSNFDLLNWVKQLGIKYFRDVFSRHNLPYKIMKKECGIINLDDLLGQELIWCVTEILRNSVSTLIRSD